MGLSTLFNPKAGPWGGWGYFGHWLGVSWIWAAVILPVHMIFSISHSDSAARTRPPTHQREEPPSPARDHSRLRDSRRDVARPLLFVLYGEHFWMGYPVLAGKSPDAWSASSYLAWPLPCRSRLLASAAEKVPVRWPLLGLVFYPAVLVTEFVSA